MRPTFLLTALSCVALACQPAPARLSEADITAIRAVTDTFVQHARVRRDSAAASLYAEDGIIMPAHQPAVQGRAAIRAWLEAFPAMSEFSLTIVEIDGRGDLAYVRGTYTLTLAPSGKTPAMPDHGKYVEVRRKQADGSWLLALDIFNSDVPLPTP